jgi:aconitate hydratase
MGQNVAQKLIGSHLADGEMRAGSEIGLRIDQTLTQDATVIAPRYLGLRLVIANSYARIHWQNLANFGVLAVEFTDPADYDRIGAGDELSVGGVADALGSAAELTVRNQAKNTDFTVRHRLSPRQVAMVLAGGQIPLVRSRQAR